MTAIISAPDAITAAYEAVAVGNGDDLATPTIQAMILTAPEA